MQYCFVFGCQRSGTTALTRLLHAHDNVVMGMERYKALLTDETSREAFGPALFEPERFLDFRRSDTNILPSVERFEGHYRRAEQRLREGDVRYVGDKVFPSRWIAEAIATRFPAPKVVFIYRDLLKVASSFEVRASNPNDTWYTTYEQALNNWTMAFEMADELIERLGTENVFAVRYERLFSDDRYLFRAMFDFLGLPIDRKLVAHFKQATSNWESIEAKPLVLDAEQQAYLLERQDASLPERFDRRLEEQLHQHLIFPEASG